jgi:MFS family permease
MRGVGDGRALRSVALQFWVNGVVVASFTPRLPEIRGRIGVELHELGLLLTLGAVGGLAASAVCGSVVERFGTRVAMTGGSIGLVCALPVIGYATSPAAFLAGLAAMACFDVICDVAMNMQASWLSARRPTPVMNRVHGLWSLGTVAGGAVATAAASAISLQVHLLAVAGVLLVVVLYVVPGLLAVDEQGVEAPSGGGVRRLLSRLAVLFGVLGFAAYTVEAVPADWAAIRLTDDLGAGPRAAGLGFVAATTGMVVGRFAGDLATARLGPARLTRLATVTAVAGTAMATLIPVPAVSIAAFGLAGLGAAVLFPRLYDEAARAPRPGATLGAMSAGVRISSLSAPIAVGFLASTPVLPVGAAMAIVVVPAGVCILALRDRRGSPPAPL